mmetsp:Transcript_41660/g.95456  ORF Transcript_41660/g.95456 Transcript_41660/m.95456 type:complete len:177 (+) Transcript_41660:1498-2028(+)
MQAFELAAARTELSPEELRAAAEKERVRLEERGEIDIIGDRQPARPPPFESLVGKYIDIRWRYWTVSENGKRKQLYIWCTGEVVEVADGTHNRTPKSKSPLPWGAVRVRWQADDDFEEQESYTWTILKPADWAREVHFGWRYAASEIGKDSSSVRHLEKRYRAVVILFSTNELVTP